MKSLTRYIKEKLIIKKNIYNYSPKTKDELQDIIKQRIKAEGNEVNLNNIDVSNITDMFRLFEGTDFNGDISEWDVSKVTDMCGMFYYCESFNKDISNLDVSKVTNMNDMFYGCKSFNQNISNWNISKITYLEDMFNGCQIEEKYKPKFSI